MNLLERVAIDPEIRGGKPCIQGTRITVFDVLDHLAGGASIPEARLDLPSLSEHDIRASFPFAAAGERRLSVSEA